MKSFYDFVIVGAGVVGLTIARSLLLRRSGSVCLVEKEKKLGMHSSGRNSGVLHAGIYYPPGSLKAKVCVQGARQLFEYAQAHGVPVRKTGKVIVATSPQNVRQIDLLYDRAVANGVRVEKIDDRQLRRIEPEAATFQKALYSPDTAVIDPYRLLAALEKETVGLGATLLKSTKAYTIDARQKAVKVRPGTSVGYGHLINAAGLQADKVAHWMGVGGRYRILPFRGIYWKLGAGMASRIQGSIYPVPDLGMPFLGVHITRTIDDEVTLGPTAIPVLGRENYSFFKGLDLGETPRILSDLFIMTCSNHDGFAKMAAEEFGKYSRAGFLKSVRRLCPAIQKSDILASSKTGIRAQLLDGVSMKLVMDLVIEDGPDSTHILNAISPAFTSSLAFAEVVTARLTNR